jgi:hypothetical protein
MKSPAIISVFQAVPAVALLRTSSEAFRKGKPRLVSRGRASHAHLLLHHSMMHPVLHHPIMVHHFSV